MPRVTFTPNLRHHVSAPDAEVAGRTVREALDGIFDRNPALRSHVIDEHGALRRHIVVFVDGGMIEDRRRLTDPVESGSELYVVQALTRG